MNQEKREQLLKRILPGLAILVIYGSFINGMLTEKFKKAETEYKNLQSSGISKEALPGMQFQQQESQQRVAELEAKVNEHKQQLQKLAGFLVQSNSSNASTMTVSTLLALYNLKVRQDKAETFTPEQLSPALKEIWQNLAAGQGTTKDKNAKPLAVYHLWLSGGYLAMHRALAAMAGNNDLQVLPVSLTMTMPENSPELEWELILWM